MELTQKNINICRQTKSASLQITIDEDYNIKDTRPDAVSILWSEANVENSLVKPADKKVGFEASFVFNIMYLSDDKNSLINSISGELPIKDVINVDTPVNNNYIDYQCVIEDVNVKLINSRKISIRSIINVSISIKELVSAALVTDVPYDACKKLEDIHFSTMAVRKKDTIRVHEEAMLPGSRQSIGEIVLQSVKLRNRQVRLIENGFNIRGDISVFIIYLSEEKKDIVWYETGIPFDETFSVTGLKEDMTEHITACLGTYTIDVKPDADGEARKLLMEFVIACDICAYEECEEQCLMDIYEPVKDYSITRQETMCPQVLIRNESKCFVNDSIKSGIPENELLQICYTDASVMVDDKEIKPEGIEVSGVIQVKIICIMADDSKPVSVITGEIPFTHIIEVPDITADSEVHINVYLEKINAVMTGGDEVAIKATVVCDVLALDYVKKETIKDIECGNTPSEIIINMPGIVGYVVKPGDTMWDIAKKYRTTMDSIRALNDKASDDVKPGDKLIIVKKVNAGV